MKNIKSHLLTLDGEGVHLDLKGKRTWTVLVELVHAVH